MNQAGLKRLKMLMLQTDLETAMECAEADQFAAAKLALDGAKEKVQQMEDSHDAPDKGVIISQLKQGTIDV